MPWLLVSDESDDPIKAVESLLDSGAWQPIEGGWLVTPREDDREKARRRSKAYRARKRHADRDGSVTLDRDARHENFEQFSGDSYSLSPPSGGVRESNPRSTSRKRDAETSRSNVTDRHADRDADPLHPSIAQLAAEIHLTDEDRDRGRAGAAAALRDHFGRHPSAGGTE